MNKYIDLGNGITKVVVEGNKYNGNFYIDTEDTNLINKYTWHLKPADSNQADTYYVAATKKGKTIKIHRLITNAVSGEIVDHLDRNPLNNCKVNLQKGTHADNMCNMSKKRINTSGITGVRYNDKVSKGRSPRWEVQVNYNGKRQSKHFSISVYGYDEAYKLAIEQREKWEKEFNIKNGK